MKKLIAPIICLIFLGSAFAASAQKKREFYAIQVYYLQDAAQDQRVDNYLQQAYLPALHRMGMSKIGVFKPHGNDTSSNKRIFVLMPLKSLEQLVKVQEKLQKDKAYQQASESYNAAAHNAPNYRRMETIVLQAFTGMPVSDKPALKSEVAKRVYELRSYEGATERLYANKVDMFNRGDEIGLFRRLGFNAVFYGEVLAGSRMPNLMYMTSFENMDERNAHWKAFGADAQWKELSAKAEYKNNVSKSDTWLLQATPYSDL
ncbi:NIPSNAP family protein [Pseudocnuella soli]|uniref:NIPSNAP family protein n=1 Tax=Pseudocnuella soli TaxID=2502779 RepID=UPI00104BAB0D|nr:NIPSNAP family protein [Pseudocnuella soli]